MLCGCEKLVSEGFKFCSLQHIINLINYYAKTLNFLKMKIILKQALDHTSNIKYRPYI